MSEPDLVEIHLLGIPLKIQTEASEHFDELMREFADITAADVAAHRLVPGRLAALTDALQQRFSAFTQAQETELADAVARGDDSIDIHYRVPAGVADGAAQLGELIDEADAFCAAGEYLLTLQTPARARAYRRWFLAQFVDQVAGAPPVTWVEWASQHAPYAV